MIFQGLMFPASQSGIGNKGPSHRAVLHCRKERAARGGTMRGRPSVRPRHEGFAGGLIGQHCEPACEMDPAGNAGPPEAVLLDEY
jgi:hypothetical protein